MDITKLGQDAAFPKTSDVAPQKGMNKRFYVACVAMQGLLSQHITHVKKNLPDEDYKQQPVYRMQFVSNDPDYEFLVRDAYKIADEFLKQENL